VLTQYLPSQLFNHNDKNKFKAFETEEDVAEWDYGAYEGLKTHEIRQHKPDWDIWTDGYVPIIGRGTPPADRIRSWQMPPWREVPGRVPSADV
jgi:broad specificity phosphatase PhoE